MARATLLVNDFDGSSFESDAALHHLLQTMPFMNWFVNNITFQNITEFHKVALADLPNRVFC